MHRRTLTSDARLTLCTCPPRAHFASYARLFFKADLQLTTTDGGGGGVQLALFMVLNYVSDANARGNMLAHAHAHLRDDGLLLVALPLRLFKAGRLDAFQKQFMAAIGFELAAREQTPKVALMAFWRRQSPSQAARFEGSEGFAVELIV